MRLDKYLVEHFGFTRNKAQGLIEAGLVTIGGVLQFKPSVDTSGEDVEVTDDPSIHWVSRSAGKLAGFLDELSSENNPPLIKNRYCLDIGSSTGGFTQILIDHGAAHIDAIDVGTEQLHPSLRNNPKVSLYEQTDIRLFQSSTIYDIITVDVSFISLREIMGDIARFSDKKTDILLLFKPQFEVGRNNLRKTGVPKNEQIIINSLISFELLLREKGFQTIRKSKAQVIGEAGNQEWMVWVKKS